MKATADIVDNSGVQPNMFLTNLPVELQECIIVQGPRYDVRPAQRFTSRIPNVRRAVFAKMHVVYSAVSSWEQPAKQSATAARTTSFQTQVASHGFSDDFDHRELAVGVRKQILLVVPGDAGSKTLGAGHYLQFDVPAVLPVGVFNSIMRFGARRRLSHAKILDMPNIRRVEWLAEKDDPNWTTSRTVKLLLEFPQLTELSLVIDKEQDFGYFSKSLSKLHNLRKLSLNVRRWYPESFRPQIDEFGPVIAGNPMLTHLELFQSCCSRVSLSRMFEQVPSNRPLALEHLGISEIVRDTDAILPHLGSLKSIHVRSCCSSTIFMLMLQKRIFPPVVKTERADSQFIDYISSHPTITSLSVHSLYDDTAGTMILETMARNGETLEYFSTCASSLGRCLNKVRNELLLLQCTHLRQLVLRYDNILFYSGTEINISSTFLAPQELGLTVIARMQQSLTLVITDMVGFKACLKMCQNSSNPLLRDLSGRIVFERPT
ncbi:hypothetical protein M378DRAFT_24115 [Amanita muscaria Koide BX008]|uniref:Uncharacterized protein n=1 Tax=Amanita muscaria (strain Koide BX008) TaxID=946122 RepID=A0A0C2SPY2_AMAMK|nr:hypothetical protein M378DRAFT_24115 [Amanita muscaria Koide BX008]